MRRPHPTKRFSTYHRSSGADARAGSGTHVTVEELRRLRADSIRLANTPRDAVTSLFPGAYRALFRGRGLEFDEVRPYQHGDDYRTLDWRVTARTGHLHTKLFHEEREHSLYLLIDAGSSMHFGSRVQYKWVLAAKTAALVTWLAVENGDRVGAIIYGDGANCHISSPLSGEAGAMRIFNLLAGIKPHENGERSDLGDAFKRMRRLAKPGTMILTLSDFYNLEASALSHLSYLARHSEIAAIHVYDPLEERLPPPGIYSITDGNHAMVIDTGRSKTNLEHQRIFQQRQEELKTICKRYGARLLSLRTDESLVEMLQYALFPGTAKNKRSEKAVGDEHA